MSCIDEKLPGSWDSVDATEFFALLIITVVLVLVGIRGVEILQDAIMKEIVAVCLLVLFGGKYIKMRGNK